MSGGPDWTPWLTDNGLGVRFKSEGTKLLKETCQPDRNIILDSIQDERRDGRKQSFLGGHKVGSIPLQDWELVKRKYPELVSNDAELARKALIKFSNDPAMRQYLIRRA